MEKKAGIPGPEILIGVVIALVLFFGLGSLVLQIYKTAGDSSEASACELETILHSRLEDPLFGNKLIEWNCPINGPDAISKNDMQKPPPLKILPKGTIDFYGGEEYWNDDYRLATYNIKKYVSGQVADCWKKAGEGKERIFESEAIYGEDRETTGDDLILGCGICTVFYFDEDGLNYFNELADKEDDPEKAKTIRINDYLRAHPHRVGGSASLYEYLGLESQLSVFPGEQILKVTPGSIEDAYTVTFIRQPGSQFANLVDGVANNWGTLGAVILGNTLYKGKFKAIILLASAFGGGEVQELSEEAYTGSYLESFLQSTGMDPATYIEQLPKGETMVEVAPISTLKERCDFIANSFSDEKLKEVWI